ncbi:MAG: hydrolase [Armatimonadota bacterium]
MKHKNLADRADSCLVVVDMQEPFLNSMYDRETVTANVNRLIDAAKIFGIPVLVTLQNSERMGGTVPEVEEHLPEHQPVNKMTFSCCGDDDFMTQLAETGKMTVVLCGIESHICVNQTAHDLLAAGYTVHVPEDAVCSRTPANCRIGIEKMRQSGAVITCTESVIYELMERAGTEEFRQVLRLIK